MEPYPAGPEEPYRPATKGEPPASVRTAINLIWAGVVLSIISSILTFVMLDDIIDQVLDSNATIDRDAARIGAIIGVVVSIAFGVAIAILFVFLLKKGFNWARIVYTVLTVISILLGLFSLMGEQPAVLLILGLIGVVLSIATLVFLYRSDSNAFFTADSTPR